MERQGRCTAPTLHCRLNRRDTDRCRSPTLTLTPNAARGRNQNGKSEIPISKSQTNSKSKVRNPKPPLPAKRPRAGPQQILTSSMPLRPPFSLPPFLPSSLPPFLPSSHFSVLRISDFVPNMRAPCACLKSEIRSSKSQTNSNDRNTHDQNGPGRRTEPPIAFPVVGICLWRMTVVLSAAKVFIWGFRICLRFRI